MQCVKLPLILGRLGQVSSWHFGRCGLDYWSISNLMDWYVNICNVHHYIVMLPWLSDKFMKRGYEWGLFWDPIGIDSVFEIFWSGPAGGQCSLVSWSHQLALEWRQPELRSFTGKAGDRRWVTWPACDEPNPGGASMWQNSFDKCTD